MSSNAQEAPNSSVQLERAYELIKTPLHLIVGLKVIEWRNETQSMGRRIVCGAALFGLAFAGVIDMIGAVAILIFTSPLECAGYKFSRNGWYRLEFGATTSLVFLSIYQYDNIFKGDKI